MGEHAGTGARVSSRKLERSHCGIKCPENATVQVGSPAGIDCHSATFFDILFTFPRQFTTQQLLKCAHEQWCSRLSKAKDCCGVIIAAGVARR